MSESLVERWDSFLASIEARFRETLPQAEKAALDSLEQNDEDFYGSLRTLESIKTQIQTTLLSRIDIVWQEQVQPAMSADGDYWVYEIKKGPRLHDRLYFELETWMISARGKLAERYYEFAAKLLEKTFLCSQCHAALVVPRGVFRSQYVTCHYCQAVNTFIPETQYVRAGWNAVDMIAAWRAIALYKAYSIAANSNLRSGESRSAAPPELRELALLYCRALVEQKATLVPEIRERTEAEIRTAMAQMGYE